MTEKSKDQQPTLESYFEGKFKSSAKLQNKYTEEVKEDVFSLKWTIQQKLMGIFSLMLLLSLSMMIILATYYFKSDNEVRIKEDNLKMVELVGITMQSYLSSSIQKCKQMAITLDTKTLDQNQRKVFTSIFFDADSEIVYLGIYSSSGKKLTLTDSVLNAEYAKENKIDSSYFSKVIQENENSLDKVLSGGILLVNVNKENNTIPYLGIAIPYTKDLVSQKVIVAILKTDTILAMFAQRGIFVTYMTDMKGNVLAHPEKEKVLSASNLVSSPLVGEMLKSQLATGQKKYLENDEAYIGSFKKVESINVAILSNVLEKKVFEEVYNIQRRNIYIMFIALSLTLFGIYFFARRITKPITALMLATDEISKGNFKVDIRPSSYDEIGILTHQFEKMSHGLQEREEVKNALGRFVNPSVMEKVLSKSLKLGGERRMAAIFFSDIRAFTSISEKLEPEEVVEFLNQYMTAMVSCIDLTFGVVDKFIGDAIMATWGAVDTIGNPAENAVNSALMMRDALIRFNSNRGTENKPLIKIGCGMNYGPVIAGQIGSENRLEYTVIGDAVNLASRVETLNKPFGTDILISEDMYAEVKDIYLVEKMKEIEVKGKSKLQTVYAVIGRLDDIDPNSPKTMKDVRTLLGIEWDQKKFDEASGEEEEKFKIVKKKEK
jgi:adenylate cyclase